MMGHRLLMAALGLKYVETVLQDKPVAFWQLNETSGTVAADSSGNGINATIETGVTIGEPGIPAGGGSFLFNGSSGYLSVPQATQLALSSQGTVEVWAKPTSLGVDQDFIGIGTTANYTNNGYRCRINSSNQADLIYASADQLSGGSVSANEWAQFVFTFTESGASQIFINGALVASGGADYSYSAGSPVGGGIGVDINDGTLIEYFNGYLSNISVYNTVLSASRIQAHYNAGIS